MKTIEEIRVENLKKLREKHKTAVNLARLIDKEPAQLNQWINQNKRQNGKTYNADSNTARAIEKKLGLPLGWMDNDHDQWPFQLVDREKFTQLSPSQRTLLEGIFIGTAANVGLDIAKELAA